MVPTSTPPDAPINDSPSGEASGGAARGSAPAHSATQSTLPGPVRAGAVHIPALDGIRGVAILMVMSLHFIDVNGAPGAGRLWHAFIHVVGFGESGVDLFFVLSGFLITGILLDAKSTSHYFRNFYARRVLRIFPLYYGALIAVALIGYANIQILPKLPPGNAQIAYWLYTCNFTDMRLGRYMGHFWSLAIEEQFYMVWPAVVWLCRERLLKIICVLAFVGAFFARIYIARHFGVSAAYYLTPGRVDGLATGAFIATMARSDTGRNFLRRWTPPFAIFIVLTTGVTWLLIPKGDNGVGIFVKNSLQSLLFGSIVSLGGVGGPAKIIAALSMRWLRLLGKYSYGMYVYHGMLVGVLEYLAPAHRMGIALHSQPLGQVSHFIFGIAATFVIAFISWHLYEKQFLKLKRYFEYRPQKLNE